MHKQVKRDCKVELNLLGSFSLSWYIHSFHRVRLKGYMLIIQFIQVISSDTSATDIAQHYNGVNHFLTCFWRLFRIILRRFHGHAVSGPLRTGCPMDSSIRTAFIVPDTTDDRSQITCGSINGAEAVFPEAEAIFDHNFKRKLINSWNLSLQVTSILSATSCCL